MSHSNIPNPIKHRRLWLGLKQDQLAKMSGLTRQTVTECEIGLYRKPPESLLRALSSSETDRGRLLADYASWIALRRRDNQYLFNENYNLVNFEQFVNEIGGGSLRGFCRALVIQRSLVQSYLSTGANWELIENCLWHVGLSGDFTRWLGRLPRVDGVRKVA